MTPQPPGSSLADAEADDVDGQEMREAPETAPGRLLLNVRQEVTWAQFLEIARILKAQPDAAGERDHDGDA